MKQFVFFLQLDFTQSLATSKAWWENMVLKTIQRIDYSQKKIFLFYRAWGKKDSRRRLCIFQ